MHKRARGNIGEDIAVQHLLEHGYQILDRNRTMRGGELDIICKHAEMIVFVEVRSVDHIDDLFEYMTPAKMSHLSKTMHSRIQEAEREGSRRLDVIFVQQGKVTEWFENVTNE